MGNQTKKSGGGIIWTSHTWNPLRGCSRVSAGCMNCYAEEMAGRFCGAGQPYEGLVTKTAQGARWNGEVRLLMDKLGEPLRWTKPRMVFVNSMSDLFHPAVPDEFIDRVFAVMAQSPRHTFQILTKRPERMRDYLSWEFRGASIDQASKGRVDPMLALSKQFVLPNVWLGVTVENQQAADDRIPLLLQCPAAVRWISVEPMLGEIDLRWIAAWDGMATKPRSETETVVTDRFDGLRCIDWVVCGGESGKNARPMHPDWARSLRDQCAVAGVPFLFKQWGEWAPAPPDAGKSWEAFRARGGRDSYFWPGGAVMELVGKKRAGRLLDGVLHDGFPGGRHGA